MIYCIVLNLIFTNSRSYHIVLNLMSAHCIE